MATKDDNDKKKTTTKKKPAAKSRAKKSSGASGITGVIGTERKKSRRKVKVSRKEMKTDELQEASAKLVDYLTQHGNGVLYTAGTVIVVVLLAIVINFYRTSKQEKASDLFTNARNLYNLALKDTPPSSVTLKGSLELFDGIKRSYDGTVEASLADFYEGDINFHLGEYKDSIDAYERFLNSKVDNNTYKSIAKSNIGYAYENQAQYDKAIDIFKDVSETTEGYLKESSLVDLGMTYERANKSDEALKVYTEFVENYPSSNFIERVRERINSIQAK